MYIQKIILTNLRTYSNLSTEISQSTYNENNVKRTHELRWFEAIGHDNSPCDCRKKQPYITSTVLTNF